MSTLVTGLFTDSKNAGEAIAELKQEGFTDKISLLAKDEDGVLTKKQVKNDPEKGAKEGAGVGLLVGSVSGMVAASIPAAPLVLAGPIALGWGVTGGALGALSGGLIGALVDLGFEESDAHLYEEHLLKGDVMVGVTGDDDKVDKIAGIMEKHKVYELQMIVEK